MDYSAKSNLSLIKSCVGMCCRIPFVADLLEQRRTLCMKNYVRKAKFIQENAAPRRKSIIFKIRREKLRFLIAEVSKFIFLCLRSC